MNDIISNTMNLILDESPISKRKRTRHTVLHITLAYSTILCSLEGKSLASFALVVHCSNGSTLTCLPDVS